MPITNKWLNSTPTTGGSIEKMVGLLHGRFLAGWLSLLMIVFGVGLFAGAHNPAVEGDTRHPDISSINLSGGRIVFQEDSLQLIFADDRQLMTLLVPYPQGLPPERQLKLVIEEFENVTAVVLGHYDGVDSGRMVDRVHTPLIDPAHSILRFGLRNQPDDHVLLRFKRAYPTIPASITLRAIVFEPRGFFGSKVFWWLAFLSHAALLTALAIIVLAVMRRYLPFSGDEFLALFPLAVALGLFCGYLWLLVVQSLAGGPLLYLGGVVVFLTGVSWRRWRWMRRTVLLIVARVNGGIIAYYVLVGAIAVLLASGHDAPFYDISWVSVAFQKTFYSFTAHDNLFQYLNSLAIVGGKPFAHYYQAEHLPYLLYGVEHRGVLAGLLCAPVLFLLGNGGLLAGGEYALFVFCGTVLTATAIFPAIALWRRYSLRAHPCLVVFLLSANSYVMVNYYYTWFKLLSAGLVLTGLYLLLNNSRKLSKWVMAGLSWGGATGLHAGAILALPAIGLLLWVRGILLGEKSFGQIVIAPLVLIVVFVGMNLPWAMTKARHFPDNNSLLKEHFLNGHDNPDGLLASARDFWVAEPPAIQWEFRLQRLEESFRIPTIIRFFEQWPQTSLKKNFTKWARLEFTFVAIILYPLCLLALLGCLLPSQTALMRPGELVVILLTAIASLTVNLVIYFNRVHIPDVTWHLPSATILLLQLSLLIVATGRGRFTAGLTVLFALAGYWRFTVAV